MEGVQDHAPEDEKPAGRGGVSALSTNGVTRPDVRSDVPCGNRIVVTRSIVVVPLHDAGSVQHGLFRGVGLGEKHGREEAKDSR